MSIFSDQTVHTLQKDGPFVFISNAHALPAIDDIGFASDETCFG